MICLASIALEPNRWKPGRPPSIRVSEWSARAAAAGFDGWELFENHYRLAAPDERGRLEAGSPPVRIFNTYEPFDDADRPSLRAALDAAGRLGAVGIKFNVGNDPACAGAYRECIEQAAARLPEATRLFCECHPGTVLETPDRLRDFTAGWSVWPFDLIVHPFLAEPDAIGPWSAVAGPHLRHAHVQMRARGDAQRFLQLEDDAPRARECLAALAEHGFRGTFSIEFTAPTGRADDEPAALLAAARRDLEFLRTHWSPPGAKGTS